MDTEENKKMFIIYEKLKPKLNENFQSLLPYIKKIEAPSKNIIKLMFKKHRENCLEQIQELEKFASIDENYNIKPKNTSKPGIYNTEKSFAMAYQCIMSHNSEMEKLSKDFAKGDKALNEEYSECSRECAKFLKGNSDKEISECILKCADDNNNKLKDFYGDMYNRHVEFIDKLEKL